MAAPSAVVIEDDADIRTLLVSILETMGFAVRSARSGTEGVELVRADEPDIVTLDVSLPGIDGYEAAARIRSFSRVPIIMITARADADAQARGTASGADDYLTKPFRPRELRERIRTLVSSDV